MTKALRHKQNVDKLRQSTNCLTEFQTLMRVYMSDSQRGSF